MDVTLLKATAERVEDAPMTDGQAHFLEFDEFGVRHSQFCRFCLCGRFGEAFQGRSSDSERFRALAFGLR